MILWINGAFGVGKTHVAYELSRRMGGSAWVADPEHLGYAMRRMTPPRRRDEFQRHPAWRHAVVGVLSEVDAAGEGTIIAPQALVEPGDHAEIVGGLRERGHRVEHVTLVADAHTLARRLRSRGEPALGLRRSWAHAQIDRCVKALEHPAFAEHVDTDGRSIDDVVEHVAASAGLPLVRGRQPAAARHATRLLVTLRHTRRVG